MSQQRRRASLLRALAFPHAIAAGRCQARAEVLRRAARTGRFADSPFVWLGIAVGGEILAAAAEREAERHARAVQLLRGFDPPLGLTAG